MFCFVFSEAEGRGRRVKLPKPSLAHSSCPESLHLPSRTSPLGSDHHVHTALTSCQSCGQCLPRTFSSPSMGWGLVLIGVHCFKSLTARQHKCPMVSGPETVVTAVQEARALHMVGHYSAPSYIPACQLWFLERGFTRCRRLASHWQSSCLFLPRAGITCLHHHPGLMAQCLTLIIKCLGSFTVSPS